MSAEELLFLVAVTVVMPIMALFIILNYQKARMKIKSERAGESLTTSELSALIDESVQAATGSLDDRIAKLEEQLHSAAAASQLDVTEAEESALDQAPLKTMGRTRS